MPKAITHTRLPIQSAEPVVDKLSFDWTQTVSSDQLDQKFPEPLTSNSNSKQTKILKLSAKLGGLLAGTIALISICGAGLEIGQTCFIRSDLQKAADAAALAGARRLESNETQARIEALLAVPNKSDQTNLTVQTVKTGNGTPLFSATANTSVNHFFLGFLGNRTEDVTVTAFAGPSGTVTKVEKGKIFPLAVGIDSLVFQATKGHDALRTQTISLRFDGKTGKATSFIEFKKDNKGFFSKLITDAVTGKQTGTRIPAVSMGDKLRLYKRSTGGQTILANPKLIRAMKGKTILLPIVSAPNKSEARVVGFLSGRVENVICKRNSVESISLKIMKTADAALSGVLKTTGNYANDRVLRGISASAVALLDPPVTLASTKSSPSSQKKVTARAKQTNIETKAVQAKTHHAATKSTFVAEKSAIKPVEKSEIKPAEKITAKTSEKSAVKPAEKIAIEPAEKIMLEPIDTSIGKSVAETVTKPVSTTETNLTIKKNEENDQTLNAVPRSTVSKIGSRESLTVLGGLLLILAAVLLVRFSKKRRIVEQAQTLKAKGDEIKIEEAAKEEPVQIAQEEQAVVFFPPPEEQAIDEEAAASSKEIEAAELIAEAVAQAAAQLAAAEQAAAELAALELAAAERTAEEQAAVEQAAAEQVLAELAAIERAAAERAAAKRAAAEQAAAEQAAAQRAIAELAAIEQAATERAAAERAAAEQAAAEQARAELAAIERAAAERAAAERAAAEQAAAEQAAAKQAAADQAAAELAAAEQAAAKLAAAELAAAELAAAAAAALKEVVSSASENEPQQTLEAPSNYSKGKRSVTAVTPAELRFARSRAMQHWGLGKDSKQSKEQKKLAK